MEEVVKDELCGCDLIMAPIIASTILYMYIPGQEKMVCAVVDGTVVTDFPL